MNKKLRILFYLLIPFLSYGQDIEYAKEVVKILASDKFKGRGYVGEGDKIAAKFICSEFKNIGLTQFKKSYLQKFTTSVNTFPSRMNLSLGEIDKTAGVDYLIEAGSPSVSGTYETVRLNINDIFDREKLLNKLKSSSGKFLIIPIYNKKDYSREQQEQITDVINFIKYDSKNPASGSIVLTNDKLTWGGSTVLYSKPSFTVVSDSMQQNFENITVDIENKFIKKYKSQNVIGYVEGKNKDSLIVLVAHYDHLGMMGSTTIFPGANDNASGIAMLLSLAKYYKSNQPKYNTVFMAFGAEELGLLGAKHFVENPLFKLSKIKFLINFDISGTGDDGIQVVNGSVYKDQFDRLTHINSQQKLLKEVKIRGEACNSDHCMFYMEKVPCFFIYTLGGIKAYHDIYDKAETLPLTKFENYYKLITQFVNGL
ncbi:MAG: M20/M25/M40 family metallo-hydrolase [Flavobacteriaceae bacterium]|nr:M20/M25/M40 family metallo-hydrolase [Flavobacteriaceae bacterium]